MDSYFNIKPMKDDFYHWIYFCSFELFNNKYYRWARIFTLLFYALITLINIYFFLTVFESSFLYRFLATFLAILSSMLINFCLLLTETELNGFQQYVLSISWSVDSTTKETKEKILFERKLQTPVIVLNTLLGIVTGFILIPVGKEQEYQFPLYFFRTYLSSFHYILDFIYFLTFPVTSFTMVVLANIFAYCVCHANAQFSLFLDMIAHVSAEFQNENDDDLFCNMEYQALVKRRLHLIAIRHKEIMGASKKVNDVTTWMLPWFSLGFLGMCLSALSYVYTVVNLGYWHVFQNLTWAAASGLTGMLLVLSGQTMEDLADDMTSNIYSDVRWVTFNNENKKTLLFILLLYQIPFRVKFTETTSVNYQLGIRIARNVYSFAAVFAKVGNTNVT